jgi:hypothetical protein
MNRALTKNEVQLASFSLALYTEPWLRGTRTTMSPLLAALIRDLIPRQGRPDGKRMISLARAEQSP